MSIEVSYTVRHVISSVAMILIGLTGGVASGKSTVAKMFKKCGAIVIDADELAREVVQPGKPAWRDIVRRFGKSVLNSDRTINRQALGQIVFHDGTELRKLEQIIHPRVARKQARLTRQAAKTNPHGVVIYDVPLLFEAGIDKRVNKTVVVTSDREIQIRRLKNRNGFTRAESLRRIRSQMPLAMKRLHADYVLDGTKNWESLSRDVSRLFEDLRSL